MDKLKSYPFCGDEASLSIKERIINSLKALAVKLSQTIRFNYLTLNWDIRDRDLVIKLYMNKPVFIKFHAFAYGFGSKWEGKDYCLPICIIPVKYLTVNPFDGLSEDDDYSEFIVSNEEESEDH